MSRVEAKESVIEARRNVVDGVLVSCAADSDVDVARELVDVPVVDGFMPAAMAPISGRPRAGAESCPSSTVVRR